MRNCSFAAAVHLQEGEKEKNLPRIQMFIALWLTNFLSGLLCDTLLFLALIFILLPHIWTAERRMRRVYQWKGGREGGNYVLPPIPNGAISPSIHLGAALHYFWVGCLSFWHWLHRDFVWCLDCCKGNK